MFIPLHDTNKLENISLQFVTLAIIAINIIVWLVFIFPSIQSGSEPSQLYYAYGYVPAVAIGDFSLPAEITVLPEPASYITYGFLHGGFMHIAGNMLFLWVFGDNVEDALGHFRFLVFYLLCTAGGALAHGFIYPASESPLVGASGACAGVIGAYLLLHPKVKIWVLALGGIPLRLSAAWLLTAWIGYQVFSFIAFPESEISWAAHIGGFLAGMLLVVFLKKKHVPLFDRDMDETLRSVEPKKQEKTRIRPWGREGSN